MDDGYLRWRHVKSHKSEEEPVSLTCHDENKKKCFDGSSVWCADRSVILLLSFL